MEKLERLEADNLCQSGQTWNGQIVDKKIHLNQCLQKPFMKTEDFSNVARAFTLWMQHWRDF